MATVTALTAARMLELADANIVAGTVVDGNLILTTRGGDDINAGPITGSSEDSGPSGYVDTYGDVYVGGAASSGGTGVTDHAELTGTENSNSHPISAITGLTAELSEKAPTSHEHSEFAPLSHAHESLGVSAAPDWNPEEVYDSGSIVAYDNCIWRCNGTTTGKRKAVTVEESYVVTVIGAGSATLTNTQFPELQVGDTIVGVVTYTGELASPGWVPPSNSTLINRVTEYYTGNVHNGIYAFYVPITEFATIPDGSVVVTSQGVSGSAAFRVTFFHLRNAGASPTFEFRSSTANPVTSNPAFKLNSTSITSQGSDRYPLTIGAVMVGHKDSTYTIPETSLIFGTWGQLSPKLNLRRFGVSNRFGSSGVSSKLLSGLAINNELVGGAFGVDHSLATTSEVANNTTENIGVLIRVNASNILHQPYFDHSKWTMIGGSVSDQTPVTDWDKAKVTGSLQYIYVENNRLYDLVYPESIYGSSPTLFDYVTSGITESGNFYLMLTGLPALTVCNEVGYGNTKAVYNDGTTTQVEFSSDIVGSLTKSGILYEIGLIRNNYRLSPINWFGNVNVYNRTSNFYNNAVQYMPDFLFNPINPAYTFNVDKYNAVQEAQASFTVPVQTHLFYKPIFIYHSYPISKYSLESKASPGAVNIGGVYIQNSPNGQGVDMGYEYTISSGRNGRGAVYQHEIGHHIDYTWMIGKSTISYLGGTITSALRVSQSSAYLGLFSSVEGSTNIWEHARNSASEYFAEFFALLCHPLMDGQTTSDAVYISKKNSLMPDGGEPYSGWFNQMVGLYQALGLDFDDTY